MSKAQVTTKHYLSESRITFSGKTAVDEAGNKLQVDVLAKAIASFVIAIKTTFPDIEITPTLETTYSDKPLTVKTTTKKFT